MAPFHFAPGNPEVDNPIDFLDVVALPDSAGVVNDPTSAVYQCPEGVTIDSWPDIEALWSINYFRSSIVMADIPYRTTQALMALSRHFED